MSKLKNATNNLPATVRGPDAIQWQETQNQTGKLYQFIKPFVMSKSGQYETGDILFLVEEFARKCYAFRDVTAATTTSYKAMVTSQTHAIALIRLGVLKEIKYSDINI
tara:strand:- start:218 stop:541 length:324 start_codon:yes stop_codon:yes gene_type:complete